MADCKGKQGIVTSLETKRKTESAPLLYNATQLQIAANKKFGWDSDKTAKIMQSLYEKKLMSYPRTSSEHLTDAMKPEVTLTIQKLLQIPEYTKYTLETWATFTKRHFDDSKVGSHPAIIPTVNVPETLDELFEEEKQLYDLLAKSLIRTIYPKAESEDTTAVITVNEKHHFKATGSIITADGWYAVDTVFPSMEIGGKIYTEKADAGTALLDALRQNMLQKKAGETIGHYQGFAITSEFDTLRKCYVASLHGSAVHMTDLGTSETGNITRLDNLLQGLPKELTKSEALLADTIRQLEESKNELGKPFPREEELQEKEKRLDELTKLLEIDGQGEELVEITEPFLIELGSQAQLDKLRASGIPYKKAETSDGKLIVKVNRKDKEAAQNAIRLEVSAIKNVI